MDDNINVILANLPLSIQAYVIQNNDGTYTIVLNNRLSYEQNVASYWHEINHIKQEDFNKCGYTDATHIEWDAHNLEIAGELCFF